MRNPRICADCRHCEVRRALFILSEEYCRHPRAVDLVTGKAVWRARQLRDPGSRLCGAAGGLWEAQEATAAPTSATASDPLTVIKPFARAIKESR